MSTITKAKGDLVQAWNVRGMGKVRIGLAHFGVAHSTPAYFVQAWNARGGFLGEYETEDLDDAVGTAHAMLGALEMS